jgi:nicotinamide-nucleotide amidase
VGDQVIFAVPGVPHEMYEMFDRAILPELLARAGEPNVIVSRTLRTWGESESGLAERLTGPIEELDRTGEATIAFLASGIEGIKVRVTVKAADRASADAVLARYEARVRSLVGDVVFGVDDDTMESVVLGLLRQRGWSLALAESVTGGLVSARLTSVPGASEVVRGGLVAYASEVKFDLLQVPIGPVVSAASAEAMAVGVARLLHADVGLSLTGVAGPTEQDGQPVGTLFVGLAVDGQVRSHLLRLPGQRDQMRQISVISALDLLRRRLLD